MVFNPLVGVSVYDARLKLVSKKSMTATSMVFGPVYAQTVALLYIILKAYSFSDHGSRDVKLQVTMEAKFGVSEVLPMCSDNESSCDDGEVAMPTEGQEL